MSVSAGRRTWEEASSPAAVRLARAYERAWRDSDHPRRRPDPRSFLDAAGASIDGPGARLAVLRADLSLRWESGEKVGARWYLERHADLTEDTIVALVYEEFCLREEDGERPDPSAFLDHFPEVAAALRRVLDIHGLVGSGSTQAAALLAPAGPDDSGGPFPEAGQTISGFYLVEELGRGSFARVFLARERELADRPVALKVTRRGSREPQTLARLQHTHIVPVHSHRIDRATGLHLLCMPYFARTTLARVLEAARADGPRTGAGLVEVLERLEPADGPVGQSSGRAALSRRSYDRAVAWWGARLAEALEHAHDRGVLHRDIKPSNVLVTAEGMPMLLDFNLAREPMDKEGGDDDAAPGGTVDYMAPEHLRALANGDPEGLDHRSDIYSLGVVLFEALTGVRPFSPPRRGGSIGEALYRAAEERASSRPRPAAIDPRIPPALDAVVRRCLEPDPADRYRSAGELGDDLRAVADDLPLAHAREPISSRAVGWLRRKRRKLAVAAAITIGLMIVSGIVLVAGIGFLLTKENHARLVDEQLREAEAAWTVGNYEKARYVYGTIRDLKPHFVEKISSSAPGRSLLGTARTIVERLRGLGDIRDLDDMLAEARDKGATADRKAKVHAEAHALHEAADRLRFDLLLEFQELPAIWIEIQQVLEPFYVLARSDWVRLEHTFGMLDDDARGQVKEDVDELLFLWVELVVGRLSQDDPAALRAEGREIIRSAEAICAGAEQWADSRETWRVLRGRLKRLADGRSPMPRERPEAPLEGEPADVTATESALVAFEWALLHAPESPTERSIAWMRQAIRRKSDDYWHQYFLAYLEDQAGHPDDALVHYSIAAALKPESAFVRYSRSKIYRSKRRWPEAFDDFKVALEGPGGRREARRILLERGVLYQQMGDFARARADYDAVTRLDPTDEVSRAARLNRANLDTDSGRFDRALAEYDALLAGDLSDPVVRHNRAILELRTGRAALAERDLSTILGRDGIAARDRVECLAERAQARLLLDRVNEAADDAREARRILPTPARDRLAQRCLLAARRYEQLQVDRPEDLALWPMRGPRLESELRDAAAALGRLAEGRDGRAFRAGLTRAAILVALGETQAAVVAVNRAAWLSPFSATARLARARVLAEAGDRRGAAAEVQWCLSTIAPDHPGLFAFRGELRLAAGDPRGALADLDRAESLGAREGIHTVRAGALAALGDQRAALDEWSLALRQDPELPEAFLGRARTHLHLGEWDLGVADLEQAAAWAQADPRIEAAVALGYWRCLPARPTRWPRFLRHLGQAAAWARSDARVEAAIAIGSWRRFPLRPDRWPALLGQLRRAAMDIRRTVEGRPHLIAGME